MNLTELILVYTLTFSESYFFLSYTRLLRLESYSRDRLGRTYLVLDSEVDLLQAVVFENLNGHGVLLVVVESLLLQWRDSQICTNTKLTVLQRGRNSFIVLQLQLRTLHRVVLSHAP